jgi:hypothetical protein
MNFVSMFTLPTRSHLWTLPHSLIPFDIDQSQYIRPVILVKSTLRLNDIGSIPVDDNNRKDWTESQRRQAGEGIVAKDVAHLQYLVSLHIYLSLVNADQSCL